MPSSVVTLRKENIRQPASACSVSTRAIFMFPPRAVGEYKHASVRAARRPPLPHPRSGGGLGRGRLHSIDTDFSPRRGVARLAQEAIDQPIGAACGRRAAARAAGCAPPNPYRTARTVRYGWRARCRRNPTPGGRYAGAPLGGNAPSAGRDSDRAAAADQDWRVARRWAWSGGCGRRARG